MNLETVLCYICNEIIALLKNIALNELKQIEIFLNEKHCALTQLQNSKWLWKLAFSCIHMIELNLRLQRENQVHSDLYTNIKSFLQKII